MKTIILITCILLFNVTVMAEIRSATVAAKVKSFDKESVSLDANGKIFKVKRSKIPEKNIRSGDSVLVTLHGQEIEAIAPAKK